MRVSVTPPAKPTFDDHAIPLLQAVYYTNVRVVSSVPAKAGATATAPTQELTMGSSPLRQCTTAIVPFSHLLSTPPTHTPRQNPSRASASATTDTTDRDDDKPYCFCVNYNSGEITVCDGPDCETESFHFGVSIPEQVRRGSWFCENYRVGKDPNVKENVSRGGARGGGSNRDGGCDAKETAGVERGAGGFEQGAGVGFLSRCPVAIRNRIISSLNFTIEFHEVQFESSLYI